MKNIKLLTILLILISISCKNTNKNKISENSISKTTSTYYFIRHAEKDISDSLNRNPHLTEKGLLRAQKWTEVFKDINFDAVYSTNFHRTRETAGPIAKKYNLELTLYKPGALDLSTFLNETQGQNILVVGHSDTTPNLVNKLISEDRYAPISDSNFANYYEVKIVDGEITSHQSTMLN